MKLRRFVAEHLGLREEVGKLETAEALISRRKMLLGASLLGGALAAPKAAKAAPPTSHTRWLVNRLTFGWTQAEQLLADTLGYHGYLEHHLAYQSIDDSQMNSMLSTYETLNWLPYQVVTLPQGSYHFFQLIEAAIMRATFSKRQLFEKMVHFWTDHFNNFLYTQQGPRMKGTDDRDVIRANALTTFPQLLSASSHSSAMLHYLGNDLSIAGNPNENFARELMELHTLGVDGGYVYQDIKEVARCFTGWIYHDRSPFETNVYLYKFDASRHDFGQKVVLGHIIPAGGGEQDGLMVLNILINHPSTAKFISKKLCRYFWGYEPPQSLIDAVAATYTATGGDIKSMLRTLFTQTDPAMSPPKFKRPFHHAVSALRSTNAVFTTTGQNTSPDLRDLLDAAGQGPFNWLTPDGYPDSFEAWAGSLLPRWNFGAQLMAGGIRRVGVTNGIFGTATTADGVADRLNEIIFGGQLDPVVRNQLRDFMLPNPVALGTIARDAVGAALSAPQFQWY